MTECGICIESYTKSVRKRVKCSSCNFECCVMCIKQYVINETAQEAHCMNCKVRYTNDFMIDNFTKKWNDVSYRNHRTQLLMNEQKSHLPDTEAYVQDVIRAEKLTASANVIRKDVSEVIDIAKTRKNVWFDKIRSLQLEIRECENAASEITYETNRKLRPLYAKIREIDDEANALLSGKREKKEKREFLMNCCMNDCKGFVNNKYKCGLCETVMCSKCHKPKDENHECNEDDIKTVEMIKKTCKSCPKCGIPTHKISGCPQMWCVECHAVWNWNTGQLDNSGRVHNPHYFNYLRSGETNTIRREVGDVRCGGDVTGIEVRHAFRTDARIPTPQCHRRGMMNVTFQILEYLNHVTGVDMDKYRGASPNALRDLRVKYLRNYITEDKWKTELKTFEKKERRKREYRELLGLYTASVQDLLRNSVDTGVLQYKEIMQMKEYTNGVLQKLNKQYNIKGFQLKNVDLYQHSDYTRDYDITTV